MIKITSIHCQLKVDFNSLLVFKDFILLKRCRAPPSTVPFFLCVSSTFALFVHHHADLFLLYYFISILCFSYMPEKIKVWRAESIIKKLER